MMNTLTYALIIALISGVLLQWHLSARHIRHIRSNRDAVPDSFADRISLEAHRKAADYNCAKTRVRLADLVVSSVLLLVWTLGGALDFLDGVIRSYQLSALWTGTVFILAVIVISALLDLPLSLYRTFGLEQRFGFNKMNLKLFVTDLGKNALLFLVIGTPLILLVLWFMDNSGAWWWLYVG